MLSDCKLLSLPKIHDPRGNLTFVQSFDHVPFDIKRIYYIYDVPGGSERGGHAHKDLEQIMIAISGSFDVTIDDGNDKKRYHLNRSYNALYITTKIWRVMDNFSSGAVCLNIVSDVYKQDDYIRDYDEFLKIKKDEAAKV